MTLRDDLYQPIPGDRPTGEDLRYSPLYDRIREARRQDEDLDQGVWRHERKLADYALVTQLAQELIATRSKDLQLAAWLTEALLIENSFAGLRSGLTCCLALIHRFGRELHPHSEDGDLEELAVPLEWLASRLPVTVRMAALNAAGHNWYQFRDSRAVGYEDKAKDPAQKKAREKALKEGKLSPEEFDKAFGQTPKAFYAANEESLGTAMQILGKLSEACDALFAEYSPGFGKLNASLEEVRHLTRQLLDKKRETEPDPIVAQVPAPDPVEESTRQPAVMAHSEAAAPARAVSIPIDPTSAAENIATAAAFLRRRDPLNPTSYLMLRGWRWGELRHAANLGDPTMLEAPPTEARCRIKQLALENRWQELLEAAETLMGHPCSRSWLDLQRMVIQACVALGPGFDAVAKAIRSELRALLNDVPELLTATMMDDSPAANAETQAWLRDLLTEQPLPAKIPFNGSSAHAGDLFRRKFFDPFVQATAAIEAGDHEKAFEVMRDEVARQRSGRGRFLRRLQLVQICVSASKESIAQPMLEDLISALETHKIEEWEERETVADALGIILSASKRIQSDAKEKQKYFERICRLDPVKALATGQ